MLYTAQNNRKVEVGRDLWRLSSPTPCSSRVSYSPEYIHHQCNNPATEDQGYNWLQVRDMQRIESLLHYVQNTANMLFSLMRDLIILKESVCQNHMVNCQIMPSVSRAKGLPQQHLPFMVFKYHFGSEANMSTELRGMLNSKNSPCE